MIVRVSSAHAPAAALAVLFACAISSGCRFERGRPAFVLPGPTVPSTISTQVPYVWDAREELETWTSNVVSHGPISLEGTGRAAVIRIATGAGEWVLRGPDLDPPARLVQTIRIRLRWTQGRVTSQPQSMSMSAFLQQLDHSIYQTGGSSLSIPSLTEWTDVQLERYGARTPVDVGYAYLYDQSDSAGVLEIDRIELVRQAEP
jgi:hypothetical protein